MSVKPLTILLLVLATAVFSPRAAANESLQSLDSIRSAAEAGLKRTLAPMPSGVALAAPKLDARLRFPACGGALDATATAPRGNQARVLVRVSCNEGANWNINVPVDITRRMDVLVLKRAMGRGESVAAGDVERRSRVLSGLASPYLTRHEDLADRFTRRPLPEGTALTADALTAALVVRRGQNVTLAASSHGIEVRAPGIAMADAGANQRVRVQNLYSLKIVEGIADNSGLVRVSP